MNESETVPLNKLQFAEDKDRNGTITPDEWIQDVVDRFDGEKGCIDGEGRWKTADGKGEPELPLYLGKKPGFVGRMLGKKPKFQKADGWIEVPDSGPVRYDTRMLRSVDLDSQTAEIATVFTIPFLREPLYV